MDGKILVRLLLDTCTFLWIVGGASDLSGRARDMFVDPDNDVYLAPSPPGRSRSNTRPAGCHCPSRPIGSCRPSGVATASTRLELDEETALHLGRLPALHRDPFDRMLVCQAIVHGLVILGP